jgi:hypothetical protein
VSYGYDNAGNRISRTINMPICTPPPQDSTETVIEEEDIAGIGQDVDTQVANRREQSEQNEKTQEVYTDVLSETQIFIYPNPTRGELKIESGELRVDNVEIFDMMGRRVDVQYSILNTQYSIDISHLPAGTYIMRIAVGDEATSWKIVRQ